MNKLIYFLKSKGIYTRFVKNLTHKRSRFVKNIDLKAFFKGMQHSEDALMAFNWYRTPEGQEYWNNKCKEWVKFLEKSEGLTPTLYSFLIEKSLYAKWYRYSKFKDYKNPKKSAEHFLSSYKHNPMAIKSSFYFFSTKEGPSYWNKISDEYVKYLTNE